jgi:ABC-type transport system involved in cytochrome bd biosynthesis fused ATPase/permease subunit
MELENINVHSHSDVALPVSPPPRSRASSLDTNSSEALEVEWSKVSLKHGKKQLLFGVSGKVKGKFLAIMGGSGSGKVCPLLFKS